MLLAMFLQVIDKVRHVAGHVFTGYGQSKDVSLYSIPREEFLLALVKTLAAKPVIISPSMSGSFSLPYLFTDPSLSTQRATAYIPVAPVGTSQFSQSYPKAQVCLLRFLSFCHQFMCICSHILGLLLLLLNCLWLATALLERSFESK